MKQICDNHIVIERIAARSINVDHFDEFHGAWREFTSHIFSLFFNTFSKMFQVFDETGFYAQSIIMIIFQVSIFYSLFTLLLSNETP